MFTDKNRIKCPIRKNVIFQVIMTNTLILEIDTNLPNYDRDSKIIRESKLIFDSRLNFVTLTYSLIILAPKIFYFLLIKMVSKWAIVRWDIFVYEKQ